MTMMPFPYKLKEFFTSFNTNIDIEEVEDVSPIDAPLTKWKIWFNCNQLNYAYLLMIVQMIAHDYTVEAIGDNYVTVTGTVAPTAATVLKLAQPTYIHGTQKKAKPEFDALFQNGNIKYPLIYLQEISPETWDTDNLSEIASRPNVRIWFLLPCGDWFTDAHYTKVINPMISLVERFIDELKYQNIIAESGNDYQLNYHANIGSTSEYGHLKDLLNAPHSGVELRATLSRLEENCC